MKYVITILFAIFLIRLHAQNADSAFASKAKQANPFLYETCRTFRLSLRLTGIYVHEEKCYFTFVIQNRSRLSYPVDFIRLYIRDRVQARRTSTQELEVVPTYIDKLNSIPANSKLTFVLAVQQFTIPDKKECFLEIFELNGGRNLSLKVNNRDIFRAKPL